MHMISKKDLNSAELETVTTSRSPTTVARGMGSPRHAVNRRRRTRNCPKPACVKTPLSDRVAHARVKGRNNVLSWYRLVGVALPPVSQWSPRGTGTTVLTYPCPSQPCFGGSKGCARVTGKAGEIGQNSGNKGRRAHPGQDRRLPSVVTHSRP